MLVGRADERHPSVARWPIDDDSRFHQLLAGRVDVVDLVGEMAEITRFAIILFAVPVEGELHERRREAGGRAVLDEPLVLRSGEKDEGEAALFIVDPARLFQ